jgi:capsular exopolysaccharide synthesis family protein
MRFGAEDPKPEGEPQAAVPQLRDFRQTPARAWSPQLVAAPTDVFEDELETPRSLLFYWSILVKWIWLIGGLTLLGLGAGVAATLLTTPIYRATTTIQIDLEPAKVVAVESQRSTDYDYPDKYYQTQYELLKSRALAARVVQNENLAYDDSFLNQGSPKGKLPFVSAAGASRTAADRAARTKKAISLLSGGLRIEPIRSSRIVKISYESPDRTVAARVSDAVAENFITWNLERRFEASSAARKFLEERLQQTRQTLEASQRRSNDYAQRNQLITIGGGAGSADESKRSETGESLAAADLASINASLAGATAARIEAEQKWRQASRTADMSLPEVLSNPGIQTLKASRDTAYAQYQQDLKLYKPDYPSMVEAKTRIDALDQQIAIHAASIRNSLRTQYEVARQNEGQFQAEVNRRKGELLTSQGKRVEQGFIDTDIATSRALYDSMLASYKEIGIAGGVSENNISFVDKAVTPGSAIKPQPKRNLVMFGFAGFALGALIAFLLERFDFSIKVPEDIEKKLNLPVLGTIPVWSGAVGAAKALEDPKSELSEGYYSVRTALQFSTEDGVPPSLLITSSSPSEGKSTSALALASGFARLGMRVLLVDGDMRDPSLHRMLSRDNGVGLSNLLAGSPEMSPALQPTNHRNLTFLACGPPPPNPAELLGGGKMRAFLAAATSQFDLVVIDGPPVMGLADAPQLAHVIDGTVMVIEAGRTKRDLARSAIRRLRVGDAHILGALLTKFDLRKAGYEYGHAHGYGYGHGGAYGYEYGARPQRAARTGFLPRLKGLGARGRA